MKKFYLLLTCLSTFAAFAQPANDDCAGAVPVQLNPDYSCGTVLSATLAGATASNVSDNGSGTPDDDVWFSFVATSATHRFSMLNRTGNATDLVHEVLIGTCDGMQSVNISDPETSTVSNLIVGQMYYLRVFSYYANASANTTFDVCIGTPPSPPANDDCYGAFQAVVNPDMSCTAVTPGVISGATPSNVSDNGAGTPSDDIWFSFVATNTQHRFSMLNRAGDNTDLVHEVMSGNCDALVSMNVSDPEASTVSGFVPGETYYVRVFTYGTAASGNATFDLCIGTPPPPPANDDCENAIEVLPNANMQCTNSVAGTIASATASNVPDNGAGAPDDDVWFYFTATSTTHIINLNNVQGSVTDMAHEVLSGECASLTSLLISDPNTSTATGLTIGATYYVRVFSYGTTPSSDTTFTLCINTPPTMTNDDCENAVALAVNADLNCGAVTSGTLLGATASNVPDNGAGTPNDDVWFSFVATATTHKFELLNIVGTPADLVHEVMSGECQALVSMNVSDPNSSTVTGFVPGNTYYVRVYSYGTSTTANTIFNVCVGTFPPPPANDECAGAIAITPAGTLAQSAIDATVGGATSSAGIPAPGCASYSGGDVWFTVAIPASGNVTIETGAALDGTTGFDSGMAVYAGECGNLSLVSCNDDIVTGNVYSRITLTGRTPGEVVYVRVWEYSNDEYEPFSIGAYDASLSAPSFDANSFRVYPNPVNDILNLSYNGTIETVDVFNLLGQHVIGKVVNQGEYALDMTALPAGTYLVKMNSEGASKTVKVLKR